MGTHLQLPLAVPLALPLGEERDRAPRVLPAEKQPEKAPRRLDLESLAGGIAEISGPAPAAGCTAAARLIGQAQGRGEPAAWIAAGDSFFFAPDLQETGTDLDALPLVRVSGPLAGARAAEHLLRSGAFGLIILDLGRHGGSFSGSPGRSSSASTILPIPVQVRLAALCRHHHAALLLLARAPAGAPPVASFASLRAEGRVYKTAFDRFACRLQIVKDKRGGTAWSVEEIFRGPDGMC